MQSFKSQAAKKLEAAKTFSRRTTEKVAETFEKQKHTSEDGSVGASVSNVHDEEVEIQSAVRSYEWLGMYLKTLHTRAEHVCSRLRKETVAQGELVESLYTALRMDANASIDLRPPKELQGLYSDEPETGVGAVDRARVLAGSARQLVAAQSLALEAFERYEAEVSSKILQPVSGELEQNDSLTRLLRDELEDSRLDFAAFCRKLGGPGALATAQAHVTSGTADEATEKKVRRALEAQEAHKEAREQLLSHLHARNKARCTLVTKTLAALIELPATLHSDVATAYGDTANETMPYLEMCQKSKNRVDEATARAALAAAKKGKKSQKQQKQPVVPDVKLTSSSPEKKRQQKKTNPVSADSSSNAVAATDVPPSSSSANLLDDMFQSSDPIISNGGGGGGGGLDDLFSLDASAPKSTGGGISDLDAMFSGGSGTASSTSPAAATSSPMDDFFSPSTATLPKAESVGGNHSGSSSSRSMSALLSPRAGTNFDFSSASSSSQQQQQQQPPAHSRSYSVGNSSSSGASNSSSKYDVLRQASITPQQQRAMYMQQQQARMAAQMQARMGRGGSGYGSGLNAGSADFGNDFFAAPANPHQQQQQQQDFFGGSSAGSGVGRAAMSGGSGFGGLAGALKTSGGAGGGGGVGSSSTMPKHYQNIAKGEQEASARHAQRQAQDAATDNEQRRKERAAHETKVKMLQEKKRAEMAAQAAEEQKVAQQKDSLSATVNTRVTAWAGKGGRANNLRALLSTLDQVLWDDSSWTPVSLGDLMDPKKVRRTWLKAAAVVHPDKMVDQTVENQMIAEAVFSTLRESYEEFKKEL